MTRLSDRAYQLIKDEVERYYSNTLEKEFSQEQHLERIILLARLETLHKRGGRAATKAQLWEEVCDILPNIDRSVLKRASRFELDSPVVGASLGFGAAGIGAAAVLMSNSLGTDGTGTFTQQIQPEANPNSASQTSASSSYTKTFETAKSFGWQAALKAQNPPHNATHWGETAALWQQAISLLDQIPQGDGHYAIAQEKKSLYQQNLQQIQARQLAAQNAKTAQATSTSPQFSTATQSVASTTAQTAAAQATAPQTAAPQTDLLADAREYGWQAAIASQNAPHPAEKWAEISKLWQRAIYTLNRIDEQHPSYADAQQVKKRYQQNLAVIRHRYQLEQDASQRLQSLQETLTELDRSAPSASSAKRTQMEAIVARLKTIPSGTVSYSQAQHLIVTTTQQIQAMPKPSPTKVAATVDDVVE